jgi:16S rRNA (cytosine967-C5)-methyltransferase
VTPAARLAAAVELLAAIDAAPRRPADAVAQNFFRERRFIGSGDRRAVSARAWDVIRAWRRLSWWLDNSLAVPRLRVGGLLLLEGWTLDGVRQAFSGGKFAPEPLSAAELAVLRRLEGHTLDHPDMPPAVRLEMPDWLFPMLLAQHGDRLPTEAAALLRPAALDLRVNLLKTTREAAQDALAAEGLGAEPTPLSPWGLRIDGRQLVTSGAAFRDGLVEIQDEGSQLVALLVDARPGQRVLDYCAGAAGKTLALAMTMRNQGHIVACDVSAPRLEAAVRRLRRAGAHNVERHLLAAGDAKWAKRRAGTFDRVLVDAPCTGTGTWRRNPDARLRLAPQDLSELVEKQATILNDAALLVRNGGRLIYATCSLLGEENERQVSAFLSRHADFRLLPPGRIWPDAPADLAAADCLTLTPARHGTDGFFCAVLERQPAPRAPAEAPS